MRRDLPSGTVTFLFTDIEGSSRLVREMGPEAYAEALLRHRRVLRDAFARHGGVEVGTAGDSFFIAFPTAPGAVEAAQEAQEALAEGPIRVRMGLHTGTPGLVDDDYVGQDVHRAARIAACGHGGQVLVSASTASLLGPDGLRDLGEHRLKDLTAPERIYQLEGADFPPLKSLHQTNLPIPSTPFLGREKELGEVLQLFSQQNLHLLTLTGPGGTGKTRLALQTAAELHTRYPDGVWWVPLAPLRDPKLVLETAGRVLGAQAGLAEHIAQRSMLLLFDNFEQVVEAAVDIAGLLASCPHLDLLVTSREPLHITGEQEYPVPPLEHEEGVGFFLARARVVQPDFGADDAVAGICRRLDHLPLALELAAARVKALSAAQILERLEQRLPLLTGGARDLPERQRTLRGAIGWSYELLTSEERRLFARLAVFRGGCTLEAAEQVTEADLDTLQSLVDKNLLRHLEDRFRMLETIREYAAERLEESGEAEGLRRCHAAHFTALAEEAYPNLRGSPRTWVDRLEREHDNLRAALDRLEASGETQLTLGLAGALWKFWRMRGHQQEGRRRLESALAADESPTAARAKALNGATAMAVHEDAAKARHWGEEALTLHRAIGDAWGIANSVFLLGVAANQGEGDFARAQPLLEESVRAFRELGDEHYTMLATFHLAWAYDELGEYDRARSLDEENLRRARTTANERMEAMSLDSLAGYAVDEGRVREAVAMLKESLRIYRHVGEPVKTADTLSRFARAFSVAGNAAIAVQLLSSSVALYEEIGTSVPLHVAGRNEETLSTVRRQLDEAAFAESWEQGRGLTVEEAIAFALDLGD